MGSRKSRIQEQSRNAHNQEKGKDCILLHEMTINNIGSVYHKKSTLHMFGIN